ncbi:hypothetical protein vBPpSSYP_147 [Pseudomonas phage vB_PpS_SYP]|nr:hypothetical protein vBPpSSYP_147 [Pseudomonas phage vB_PpS_SYP]
MANFLDTINEWVEATEKRIDETLQTITIKVGESVIMLSPVDTGRFRGNWQLTIDGTSANSLVRYDQDGSSTLAMLAAKANSFTAGQVAYIQNHVLYGHDLEWGTYNGPTQKVTAEGFSTQAPAGMVRVTEADFIRIVNDAVRIHREV